MRKNRQGKFPQQKQKKSTYRSKVEQGHTGGQVELPMPLNEKQGVYLEALRTNEMVVAAGPAGTGKTFIAAMTAAYMIDRRIIDKVILTRPNVPGGNTIGLLPGELEEKFGPWLAPFTETMKEALGVSFFDYLVDKGKVEMIPFEYMRGRSWERCFILLDEAQNTTQAEMKMFLTRLGQDSLTLVDGDLNQSDIGSRNGLAKMIELIQRDRLPVPIVNFTIEDVVRSGLCRMWIEAWG